MANAYEVLGLIHKCTDEDIKRAWKRLAIDKHPDKGGNPEEFAAIAEAYEKIKDPESRAKYDESIKFSAEYRRWQKVAGGEKADSPYTKNLEVRKGKDIYAIMEIPLDKLLGDDPIEYSYSHKAKCGFCDGEGVYKWQKCQCVLGGADPDDMSKCRICGGGGIVPKKLCPQCDGSGLADNARTIRLKPEALRELGTVVVPGCGEGGIGGGANGNLLLTVVPLLERPLSLDKDSGQPVCELHILDMILGARIKIKVGAAVHEIAVPPCSTPDSAFSIKGFKFRLKPIYPVRLSGDERDCYERLREINSYGVDA